MAGTGIRKQIAIAAMRELIAKGHYDMNVPNQGVSRAAKSLAYEAVKIADAMLDQLVGRHEGVE